MVNFEKEFGFFLSFRRCDLDRMANCICVHSQRLYISFFLGRNQRDGETVCFLGVLDGVFTYAVTDFDFFCRLAHAWHRTCAFV